MEQKASETKRQHYVPQTYLKRFSLKRGKEYYINALPKNSCDVNQIKELNIKNVCLENNIYTLPFENTKEKMIIEQFFSDVESNYDKVYNTLIGIKKTTITEEERAMIITTVVTMFFRTSFWRNQINYFGNKSLEKAYLTCKQYNRDYFCTNTSEILIKDKTLEELQNESEIKKCDVPFLLTLLNAMEFLFDMRFQNDDICVVEIEDEKEFITSDNPVIAYNEGMIIAPISPENTMFLPIDNKHILWLLPNNNETGRLRIFRRKIINNKEVEDYNSKQKQYCERFLLGTKSSILSIFQPNS